MTFHDYYYIFLAIGSAFGVLDKITRPSVEFQVEAQEKIVKEDEKGGE